VTTALLGRRYPGDRKFFWPILSDQELDQKIIDNLPMEGSEVEVRAFLMGVRHLGTVFINP
jgi:hypothetical protein